MLMLLTVGHTRFTVPPDEPPEAVIFLLDPFWEQPILRKLVRFPLIDSANPVCIETISFKHVGDLLGTSALRVPPGFGMEGRYWLVVFRLESDQFETYFTLARFPGTIKGSTLFSCECC